MDRYVVLQHVHFHVVSLVANFHDVKFIGIEFLKY